MKYPRISVLMGAYREEDVIGKTLKHLTKEIKYPNLEILVAVDTEEDKTLEIAKDFAKKNKKIKIDFSPTRRGLQNALNSLLKKSKGDIVVKCDAEFNYMNPSKCFYNLVKYYQNPKVGGVVFKSDFPEKIKQQYRKSLPAWGENLISLIVDDWRKDNIKVIDKKFHLFANLDSFRKSVVSRLDPKIINDEVDVLYAITSKGYKVVYAKDIIKYGFSPVPNFKVLYMQKRRSAFGLFSVANKRKINLPKYYLSIFFFFLKNLRKYDFIDLAALFCLIPIFIVANIDAYIKYLTKFSGNIWVRYKRK
jgi:glycosyltransferase involved in cell wall biosynthesis